MVKKLTFVDLKTKKKFTTNKFTIKKIANGRTMALAIAPSGVKSARFVVKGFKK